MFPLKALLNVGRVSNLPTIWTNILAAAILAQASLVPPALFHSDSGVVIGSSSQVWFQHWPPHSIGFWLATMLALSMMYIGGMFLNDAFDARWDKNHNNPRPIMLGHISAQRVWLIGSSLMVFSVLLIGSLYWQLQENNNHLAPYQQYYGLFAAILLAMTIIAYNAWHKIFAHSAVLMGACRLGVYLIAALLLAQLTWQVSLAALSLLLYIAGLTYLARYEHINRVSALWPLLLLCSPAMFALFSGYDSFYFWLFLIIFLVWVASRLRYLLGTEATDVKACIGGLLAAIPLLDGLMLASIKAIIPSLLCLIVFLIIPRLHQWVSGT